MTAEYLLSCRCGRQIVIQTRQAGQTITCSCGASLLAPTLLDMTSLEPAPQQSPPEPVRSAWGWRHRLWFLGSVLVLTAVVGGTWLYLKRPISAFDTINPEHVRQNAKKLLPSQTWKYWEMMKQGLDRRMDQRYAAALEQFHVWCGAVAVVALCGIGLIVAGVLALKQRNASG